MPFKSQQQRKLGYAAAAKPGGVDGMPQAVGKTLVADDKPGKLPPTVAKPKAPMPPKARAAPPPSRFPAMSSVDKASAAEVTRRVAARSK